MKASDFSASDVLFMFAMESEEFVMCCVKFLRFSKSVGFVTSEGLQTLGEPSNIFQNVYISISNIVGLTLGEPSNIFQNTYISIL